MKTIYIMATKNCNLSCSHCDIRCNSLDDWNNALVLEQLKNNSGGHNIIFGGEPALHPNRIKMLAPYSESISTNLTILNKELIEIYATLNVATSWNVSRFTNSQYELWLSNIKKLRHKPALLVTLTPDLISSTKYFTFFKNEFDGLFEYINFEQLLDSSKNDSYYNQVDLWLCELYQFWKNNIKTPCSTFQKKWHFDCSNTYTILPNGSIKYGCPQFIGQQPSSKCYICSLVAECKPCMLQRECTRPNNLLKIINKQ